MQIHRGRIEGANHSEEQGLGSGILQALAAEGWLTVHLAFIKGVRWALQMELLQTGAFMKHMRLRIKRMG